MKKQTILKTIGEEHLSLYQQHSHYLWVYDDGCETYEAKATWVEKLSHMTIEEWVAEGQEFMEYVKKVKEENGA